ncbi:calcium-transporting ATPase PMC1 [Saccharomyces eubayanus]|uniref:calcium-transporting ATPase PMC1 n=1 Tax=Saccharomyces eubayanus TaxID=1080349 RepID=UPI0006C227C2|nr:PMC1-like protein [Saccharomyces eubayanus]KOG99500.1 PMC1-like protein [Saccharomyces eubayanus]
MSRQDENSALLANKANNQPSYTRNQNGDQDDFKLSKSQLSDLHNPKSVGSFIKLFGEETGNFFKYLKTDRNAGISLPKRTDYRKTTRYKNYGDNSLPERVPKSFLQLVWIAFNDKTMELLSVAAVVSFVLGLYELWVQPPQYDPEGNLIRQVDWIEGVAIMMAVLVVVLVSAANDYQKELQFAKLNKKKEDRKIIAIRNDQEVLISIHHALVGDIISLQTGDVVPADCVMISGKCEADESSMTGESNTIKKLPIANSLKDFKKFNSSHDHLRKKPLDIGDADEDGNRVADCMLISGSRILSGLGRGVITSVGINSVYGQTMTSLNVESESTPLQLHLSQLADNISVYGCVAAIILFLVLFVRYLFYVIPENGRFHDLDPAQKGSKFMNILITSITVIVVAVPEGLPLAVTLALAFATTRMTKDGNLVRVLRSCETMGSATAVCSDKTGTLTENVMSVVRGFLGNFNFDDNKSLPVSEQKKLNSKKVFEKDCSSSLRNDLLANIVLNSTAFENRDFKKKNKGNSSTDRDSSERSSSSNGWMSKLLFFKKNKNDNHEDQLFENVSKGKQEPFIGSKTETALLSLARFSLGLQVGELQDLRDQPTEKFNIEKIVQTIPFESSRKWAGLVVKYRGSEGKRPFYRLYVKGAAEIVFQNCLYKRNSDDTLKKIDEETKEQINGEIKNLASGALRAISVAHRDFYECESWPPEQLRDKDSPNTAAHDLLFNDQSIEKGLILDGILGIQDPLREGVRESVLQCQRAGVTVRMVTGDNILTAKAIARNCSILSGDVSSESYSAMEGTEFRKLTKNERIRILPNLKVLARSSPEDKRLLVETLKGMGDVVAVTGDGTNDAPALKLADVGFSMGISGTEVAREASDIILMTDDFSAIVNAIKWGRCVSVSIKKFIQFQLIVNITAVILTFVSSVASSDETSVLTAVQLLWINLIMDTLAALALATDKPDPNIMDRKPKGRSSSLISVSTWKMILSQATLQLIVTFILHFYGPELFFNSHEDQITSHQQQQLNAMTFNTFVWLQFFTMLVSRKLDEADGISSWRDRISTANLNFFQDLGRNYYFLTIMAIIGGCQVLIMFFGGAPFSIARQTKSMWITAVLCGMLSLIMGLLVRIIPDEVALKAFPVAYVQKFKYVFGLEFLRRKQLAKNDDEEALLDESDTPESTAFY